MIIPLIVIVGTVTAILFSICRAIYFHKQAFKEYAEISENNKVLASFSIRTKGAFVPSFWYRLYISPEKLWVQRSKKVIFTSPVKSITKITCNLRSIEIVSSGQAHKFYFLQPSSQDSNWITHSANRTTAYNDPKSVAKLEQVSSQLKIPFEKQ